VAYRPNFTRIYNFGFGSAAAALASLLSVTLPFALPSPKKMTSTVKSSLVHVSQSWTSCVSVNRTCIASRKDSAE
jgi:hypothetical protein